MLVLPTATYRATAFLRAAAALGAECVVASEEQPTLAALMDGHVLTLDLTRPAEAAARAAAFADRWPVDAVLGVDESSVLTAAHMAERLGLAGNSVSAVAATRDKRVMRALVAAASVPQPRWVEVTGDAGGSAAESAAGAVGVPCVVKPVDLAASRGVVRADSVAELAAAIGRVDALLRRPGLCGPQHSPALLVEQFIPGKEIAVEGLLIEGDLTVLAVFDKPDPLDGPFFAETLYVTPSRHPSEVVEEAVATTRRAVRALGLVTGPIHAELRITGAGCVFLEVAARSVGGRCSSALCILDGRRTMTLEELILRQALSMSVWSPRLTPGAAGVFMLPVPHSGMLRGVRGVDEASAVAGVTGVELTIPPGQEVEALPEGDRYLGFITARGIHPDDVEQTLRSAAARVTVLVDQRSM